MKHNQGIMRGVLPNGLVLICETMPQVRSVSLGIWVRTGSRNETPAVNGISHFIEHMVFKGTSRRTAEEIAREMDSVGGFLDAFTSKEMVSFSARVLDEHLPVAFDILSDLVLDPVFRDEDIAREKQVILEEIRMEEDNPESLAHEVLIQNFWRGHPLGRPILGTRATVRNFTRRAVLESFRRWYAPTNIILTAAGNISWKRLRELAAQFFGRSKGKRPHAPREPAPQPHSKWSFRDKPNLEQAHITIAAPAYPLADERRYAASVLNSILGGSMSSRLFQNIRERQGLAYAVFSELNPYSDAGMLSIYAGTGASTAERVLRSVADEMRCLKQDRVTEEELRRAKDHLQGSLVLALESPGARMSNLARQEMYFGRFFSIEELQRAVESVTREQILETAREFFRPETMALSIVGPLQGRHLARELLAC